MFSTLGSFSAVYFSLATILFFLILFEKKLVVLEDKIRANKKGKRKGVK